VVPFFRKLIADGADSLPITDERMTRFWITLTQGVNFVLSSMEMMRGGEIYVPKIPSTTIPDVATLISPTHKQHVIGIRPGEKLHETMIPADDAHCTVELDDRYVILASFRPRRPRGLSPSRRQNRWRKASAIPATAIRKSSTSAALQTLLAAAYA